MRPRSRLRLVALGALLLVAITAVPSAAAAPKAVSARAGKPTTVAQQRTAVRYWTAARMRAAVEVPSPTPDRRRPLLGNTDHRATGKPGLIPGGRGADTRIPTGSADPEVYQYPFPYTGYALESPLYSLKPYKTVGKVFFRQGGFDYVCSGASVVGGTRQVVYTAGHCLSDGAGTYSRKIVFVPAYRNGSAPYGRFPWKNLWVYNQWHQGADSTLDLGAFDVAPNANGTTLRRAVGKLGFAYNLPRDLHWNAFGYPAESPFTGEVMHVCQASRAADDLSVTGAGLSPMAIGCHMLGGSSGGPWVWRLKKGDFLNGLNSYGYDASQPEAMYGPYFGSDANRLRCIAGTGDPTPPNSCLKS